MDLRSNAELQVIILGSSFSTQTFVYSGMFNILSCYMQVWQTSKSNNS